MNIKLNRFDASVLVGLAVLALIVLLAGTISPKFGGIVAVAGATLFLGGFLPWRFRRDAAQPASEPVAPHVAVLKGIPAPTHRSTDLAFDRLYYAAVDAPQERFSEVTVRTSDLAQILSRVDRSGRDR